MAVELPKLDNDTIVNVAQLLKQPVGAARTVDVHLDEFALDHDLTARDVNGAIRLTRIASGILAGGRLSGVAALECVRCLTEFDQPFISEFDAEFRPSVDVRTGEALSLPEDSELFVIDNNHQLDLGEVLRQTIILALPMRPVCGELCPGFLPEFPSEGEAVDERLAALRALLDEGAE